MKVFWKGFNNNLKESRILVAFFETVVAAEMTDGAIVQLRDLGDVTRHSGLPRRLITAILESTEGVGGHALEIIRRSLLLKKSGRLGK